MGWLANFPDVDTVWTATVDLNGQARGKRLPAKKAGKLDQATAKMPLSALSLDIFGNDVVDSPLVFETGDQDGFLRPTARGPVPMPWVSGHALLLPMTMEHGPDQPFWGDPRHALQRVLDRYSARGWKVFAATELEFYLLDETGTNPLAERMRLGGDILGLQSLEAYDRFLTDLYSACRAMGIPAETVTSESGSGQFEVTLTHGPAAKAADDTWLFKMLVKGLARNHDMAATFVPKPYPDDAGTGMHMHFSVTDTEGRNVFDNGTDAGSETLLQAVAGCLSTMADATLIFAPHQNSYTRLVPGAHAPTGLAWGYENRTVALRIPAGPGSSRRIEHRVAGGDVNPYLLFATVLGGALMGIEDGLKPPPPTSGNAYESDAPTLAPDWETAIALFAESSKIQRLLPHELIQLFVGQKRQEVRHVLPLDDAERRLLYLDRV